MRRAREASPRALRGRTRPTLNSRRETSRQAVVLAAAQERLGLVSGKAVVFVRALIEALAFAVTQDGFGVVAAFVRHEAKADALEQTVRFRRGA